MIVADVMTRDPLTVSENTSLDVIARVIVDHHISCIPVLDSSGALRGIITAADLIGNERDTPFGAFVLPRLVDASSDDEAIELLRGQARQTSAAQIMSSPVETVSEDEPLAAIVGRMVTAHRQHLPVVRDGRLVGIVSRRDLLRVIAEPA